MCNGIPRNVLLVMQVFGRTDSPHSCRSSLPATGREEPRTTRNYTRRSGSKSGSGRWSHFDEIRGVHYAEILHRRYSRRRRGDRGVCRFSRRCRENLSA
jgi:hypothetical protein